ncbi:ectonucleoside triphosphate diphosphohydrolase 2-like isoform X2 [Conger conger]|uniref:ectonucleoside triphosphate diphosphohydrolase 2-like isoform X2 n=1 Tax=Conger conger TaxID=82655 RepID=UPI002A59CB29|nr:ectonucleoside triphosphate diphosphohydrolase 2-like isoform X2 [Conger conger]
MASQYCKVVVPVALLLLGVLAILLLTIPTEDAKEPPDYMYGIVLDAGSSHTAMYIYKWPADKQNGTGIVTQHGECHVKGGGISSYAGQQGGAGRSLQTCLQKAVKDIPKSRHVLTPVYLGATAGMRLLTISDPSVSKEILQEVGDKIKSYPFNFRGAAILSGQEEGAYGWVTVNYLLENFIKYGYVGRWLSPGRGTVGALDFGGASTQITFSTRDTVEDQKNSMTLRLYGQDYRLYTHSFLCYGQDQMLRRLLALLLQTQGYPSTVTHPCFPAGHSVSTAMGKVFDSPCTAERKPTPYDPRAPVTVLGSGHYQQCLGNVTELFSFGRCSFSQCSFDQVFQPNVSGDFMAFAAFYYVHSFLKLTTGITVSSPTQLEEAARAVCNLTFQEMLAMAPSQEKRLQHYCPASVYIQVLLLQGYKFDELSLPRVSFQSKAGGASVGWALGYMLTLSSLLPGESPGLRKALHPGAWGTLLFLCVLLLIAGLGYLLLLTSRRKNQDSNCV